VADRLVQRIWVPHTPVLRVRVWSHLRSNQLRKAPLPARTTRVTPLTRLARTSLLLRVFPVVTFPPHLHYNSPRLNDLASRSNEYLTSKRFLCR
jgi:hypothetical protein